jgi:hypothetical protein
MEDFKIRRGGFHFSPQPVTKADIYAILDKTYEA